MMQIQEEEEEFKTYEDICLEKLKEIGKSTAREWCSAMGYEHGTNLAKVIRRIRNSMPDKIKVYYERNPRQYEALI
ncbi:MAG: hypothetical protein P8Y70_20305 [Candidatus Lokiarchaeota archaeon]